MKHQSLQQKQSNEALQDAQLQKKQAAVNAIEQWPLRQYFFNMLRYASAKKLPWPRLDFTLNGQLLFRLEIDDVEQDDDSDADSDDGDATTLEFTLKYFGLQTNFLDKAAPLDNEYSARCRFKTLPNEDDEECANQKNKDDAEANGKAKIGEEKKQEAIPRCSLDKSFWLVLEDDDAPSGLCYAASFDTVDMATLDQILARIKTWFTALERDGSEGLLYSNWPLWTVERVLYNASHDARAVALEIKDANDDKSDDVPYSAPTTTASDNDAVDEFEREMRRIDASALAAQKSSVPDGAECISSCQLHADVWQYNDKHKITSVGRQYENLGALECIGNAMHVPFRGAPDDLQKKLYIGSFLVRMLPTLCLSLAYSGAAQKK